MLRIFEQTTERVLHCIKIKGTFQLRVNAFLGNNYDLCYFHSYDVPHYRCHFWFSVCFSCLHGLDGFLQMISKHFCL